LFSKLDRPKVNIEMQQKAKANVPAPTQSRSTARRMTKVDASVIRKAIEKTELEKLKKR
jgi:hypothetical protein